MVGMGPFNAETQEQRDSVIRQMAATVAEEGIDAVIIVSEVWEAGTMPASQAADRREFLTGMLAVKQGDGVSLRAAIHRDAGMPALNAARYGHQAIVFQLEPLHQKLFEMLLVARGGAIEYQCLRLNLRERRSRPVGRHST
jgi:hypothetical protein